MRRLANNQGQGLSLCLLVIFLIGSALPAACTMQTQQRRLITPALVRSLDGRSPFLKAHTLDGRVYILSPWQVDSQTKTVSGPGELIAIHADSVFVLSVNSLKVIPKVKIKKATLTVYDANWGPLSAWSVLGRLSTTSHGIGLIISALAWILAGTIATSAQSYAPRMTFPGKPWQEFRKYARFPNGLPPRLDRRALRSK